MKRLIDVKGTKPCSASTSGPFGESASCIPQMRELGRGSVVLFSSTAGLQASKDVPIYSVTKAAVVMMTRTLALNHAAEISAQTVSAPEPSPAVGRGRRRLRPGRSGTGRAPDEDHRCASDGPNGVAVRGGDSCRLSAG
ncbi:SDR family oxidoreductase, partial [Mesorhizobium sp. M7A.F.Ca.US.003.02.2.1]